jgi:hypothetical protein
MKLQKSVYWIATGLFALWMLLNAKAYLFSDEARQLCAHFGFPDYFRIELGIAKFIGVIILVTSASKSRLVEWTYAGFGITIISGFIAHVASGDTIITSASALLALAILVTSYVSYHSLLTKKS